MKHTQHFVFQGNEYYLKFALEIQIGLIYIYLPHVWFLTFKICNFSKNMSCSKEK